MVSVRKFKLAVVAFGTQPWVYLGMAQLPLGICRNPKLSSSHPDFEGGVCVFEDASVSIAAVSSRGGDSHVLIKLFVYLGLTLLTNTYVLLPRGCLSSTGLPGHGV